MYNVYNWVTIFVLIENIFWKREKLNFFYRLFFVVVIRIEHLKFIQISITFRN